MDRKPTFVAFCLILLCAVACGDGRALRKLLGLEAETPSQGNLLVVEVQVPEAAAVPRLLEEIGAVAGLERCALVDLPPSAQGTPTGYRVLAIQVEGRPAGSPLAIAPVRAVSSGYFATLGRALLNGRDFAVADRDGSPLVAVVNQAMVQRVWPGETPLGRRLRIGGGERGFHTVVGVVQDGPGDPGRPEVYLPYSQSYPWASSWFVLARASGEDPAAVASRLRAMKIGEVRTLAEPGQEAK